jgi:glycosyltransferase involved in cell wall biosynthesis
MEESTMALSDTLVVNSKFTLNTVKNHFTSLSSRDIAILYPALDTSKMTSTNQRPKTKTSPIVSLNRFERKKNIGLLIEAFAYLQRQYPELTLPPLIIAGGYDTQNVENVQHRGELGRLATRHQVVVDFRLDISDHDRAVLFQTAMCVVYTPDREHFGIVPLEAMYAGTPVLAVNSGGPTETVVDGRTGFLREATATAFGEALRTLMEDPHKATEMGRAGREHVQRTFGPERFQQEWKDLVEKTVQRGRERMENSQQSRLVLWMNTALYLLEAFVAMVAVLLLTLILRHVGLLDPEQSILGKFRTRFQGDEL